MGKSSPSQPDPIDPEKVASSQQKANINTAIAQNAMNQVSSSDPYSSTNYYKTGTVNVDGQQIPTYGKSTQLSAPLSSILTSVENAAQKSKYGLDTSNLVGGGSNLQDPQLLAKKTTDALYNQATSRLDPQWEQTQRQLEAKLATQGLAPGSEAYGQAMDSFNRSKNDAYTSAQNAATQAGVQDASQLYQDILAGRQQGVNEQTQSQTLPMNLLTQIMTGSASSNTSTPQVNVQSPDILSAYGLKANQDNSIYNSQVAQSSADTGSTMGMIGSLAAAAAMYF